MNTTATPAFDVFISHASKGKGRFVDALDSRSVSEASRAGTTRARFSLATIFGAGQSGWISTAPR